ncbi:MAG: DUF87 domain-containing protein [Parcubacteria group bacterium]
MVGAIFTLAVLVAVIIAGFVIINGWRSKGHVQRALNMTLFLVRIPKEKKEQGSNKQQEKEAISVSEQLFASFVTLHEKGWNRFIYGEPYVALELAVHHVGEETHFYIAVPRSNKTLIEKQIHAIYPTADVSETEDYNIFNPQGGHAGAYLMYTEHSVLPIKTYQLLEGDPLGAILTAMSKLQAEGEGIAMQIIVRPNHDKGIRSLAARVAREMQSGWQFKQSLHRAKHPPKEADKDKEKNASIFNPARASIPRVVTPADETVIKSITTKANKQLFDVNVRLVASAPSEPMAEQVLNELSGSFAQFATPDFNTPKVVKVKSRALNKLIYNFAFRLFDKSRKMLMSTEEIASIFHMPTSTTSAPRVKFLESRASEPPPDMPREGIHLGDSAYRGQKTPIRMTPEDRRRHFYIIGQTGTGKSSMMKHMIEQDLAEGRGLCVIEPHGDFAEHALSVIPPERANDVIYFNPADLERPLGLNIFEFDPNHPEQKTLIINELLAIIDKLYNLKETGGPLFEKYFKNSCLLLMDDFQQDPTNEKKIPVLADISRVLVDDEFRRDKLSREPDPLVRQFWQLEAEKAGGESALANMAPYISSKIDTFVSSEFLRTILNQKHTAINFRDIIDNGKILIVSLSKGRIGETNANLLGMLIVTKLLAASLSRVDTPEDDRRDFYLYLDEFQNITTDSIATILSEARKYRLNLTIAHQFIKQLPENIRDSVFGNVGSIAAFRVGPEDGDYMKNIFAPEFEPQDLSNIDNFNVHVKLLVNGKTTKPFNIQTVKEANGDPQLFEKIKELSRMTYGRPRAEIEEEIRKGFEDQNIL